MLNLRMKPLIKTKLDIPFRVHILGRTQSAFQPVKQAKLEILVTQCLRKS